MIPERTTTFMYRWAPKEAEALIHECVKDRIMSMVHSGYKYTANHGNNLEITITTRILTDEQLQEEHKTKLKKFQDEIEERND